MQSENDIQKLLRLKRYEQPPPGYYEDFLKNFHERQRAELIKRPLWQLMLDRLNALLPEVRVPGYAYGATFAAFMVLAGYVGLNTEKNQEAVAPNQVASASAVQRPELAGIRLSNRAVNVTLSEASLEDPLNEMLYYRQSQTPPRYEMGQRPVSYNPYSF